MAQTPPPPPPYHPGGWGKGGANYVSVFLDITIFANFQCKNANVSRTQKVCHVFYTFLNLL